MEIEKIGLKKIQRASVKEATACKSSEAIKQAESCKEIAEAVEISDNARMLIEGLEAVQNASELRPDKIEALKAQILSGNYEIDAEKLAEKMIAAHLEADLVSY